MLVNRNKGTNRDKNVNLLNTRCLDMNGKKNYIM